MACGSLPTVPQYRAPFSVDSNLSMLCVNWSGSFALNGPLREFVLTDGGRRVYSGLDTTLYIPRTADRSEFLTPIPQLYEVVSLSAAQQRLLTKTSSFKCLLPVGKVLLRGNRIFIPICYLMG